MALETVSYLIVRKAVAQLAGLKPDALSDEENSKLMVQINDAFKDAWERHPWAGLMRLQHRWYRLEWSAAATYAAGDEVFYTPSGRYYQSLKAANTNNAPATGDPLAENSAWWAESRVAYSADPYDASTAYVAGDKVFYQTTGRYYQCHTASTGNAPIDTNYWGVLTDFDRYVDYEQAGQTAIGHCMEVYDLNPRVRRDAAEVDFELSENGVQVNQDLVSVWLWFKIRFTDLLGDDWSGSATYSAGDQVYFQSGASGDFYTAMETTSAGESPASAAAKWQLVGIPKRFQQFLTWAGYANWLDAEGQTDKAVRVFKKSLLKLDQQFLIHGGQQQQQRKVKVRVR